MSEALQFLQAYCDFSDPHWVWILTGMSRNKDNPNPHHDYLQRLVVKSPEDIEECYKRIRQETNDPATAYRLYVSLNARDAVKTVYNFQHTLLDIGYGLSKGQPDALVKAKKIASIWKDELAQSSNRATKRILLDVDTTDAFRRTEALAYLDTHGAIVRAQRITPNGFHIVIDACDTRDFMAYCKEREIPVDLQRDSLVYVEKWMG